jgi:hypothetical protein
MNVQNVVTFPIPLAIEDVVLTFFSVRFYKSQLSTGDTWLRLGTNSFIPVTAMVFAYCF